MSLSRRRFLSTLLTSLAVAPLAAHAVARQVMGAPVGQRLCVIVAYPNSSSDWLRCHVAEAESKTTPGALRCVGVDAYHLTTADQARRYARAVLAQLRQAVDRGEPIHDDYYHWCGQIVVDPNGRRLTLS